MIAAATRVIDSDKRAAEAQLTRLEKLQRAASEEPCVCGGIWFPGAEQILERNGIDAPRFRRAFRLAFDTGARRGLNIALVGQGGSGKSSLIEPLEGIFETGGKPQRGSSFPFTNAVSADLLLWQDYRHSESTVCFTDLLSVLVGETIEVRVPGCPNQKWKNNAPMIYSGRAALQCGFQDEQEKEDYDNMMRDRFTLFRFTTRVPNADPNHPKCMRCCAEFFLDESLGGTRTPPATPDRLIESQRSDSVTTQLLVLSRMHREGTLSDEEFAAAKSKILV